MRWVSPVGGRTRRSRAALCVPPKDISPAISDVNPTNVERWGSDGTNGFDPPVGLPLVQRYVARCGTVVAVPRRSRLPAVMTLIHQPQRTLHRRINRQHV